MCSFLRKPSHLSIQLTKAHRQGHMVKVDWLDRLTFREIEMINEVSLLSSILVAQADSAVESRKHQ